MRYSIISWQKSSSWPPNSQNIRAVIEKNKIGVFVNPDVEGAYWEVFRKIIAYYPAYTSNIQTTKKILNRENEKGKLLQLYSQI